MPDRRALGLALLLVAAIAPGLRAQAEQPDLAALRADVMRDQGAQMSPDALNQKLDVLRVTFGMPRTPLITAEAAPGNPAQVTGAAKLGALDLRVALAQLAIFAGANQQLPVIAAQGGRTDALILRGGIARLSEVATMARRAGLSGIASDDRTVTLTRPLIVWEGAELLIEDGTNLRLSADSGAFLLGFGHIGIGPARISASPASSDAGFRPFLLAAGTGSLHIDGATISGLGRSDAGPYSGIAVVSGGLFRAKRPSAIFNTRISDSGPVSLIRTSGVRVATSTISDARGVGLYLSDSKDALVSGNVIVGTQGLQALRITASSASVHVVGNTFGQGAHSGVLIDRNVRDIRVTDNAIGFNQAGAMRLQRAACVTIARNLIVANGGPGVGLDQVQGARIDGNVVAFNSAAGLSLSGQRPGWQTEVTSNLIADNGEGMRGATAGRLHLLGNRIERQHPRLFSGDLGVHTVRYLTQQQARAEASAKVGFLIAPALQATTDAPECEGH